MVPGNPPFQHLLGRDIPPPSAVVNGIINNAALRVHDAVKTYRYGADVIGLQAVFLHSRPDAICDILHGLLQALRGLVAVVVVADHPAVQIRDRCLNKIRSRVDGDHVLVGLVDGKQLRLLASLVGGAAFAHGFDQTVLLENRQNLHHRGDAQVDPLGDLASGDNRVLPHQGQYQPLIVKLDIFRFSAFSNHSLPYHLFFYILCLLSCIFV